jgi:hypothetical protein
MRVSAQRIELAGFGSCMLLCETKQVDAFCMFGWPFVSGELGLPCDLLCLVAKCFSGQALAGNGMGGCLGRQVPAHVCVHLAWVAAMEMQHVCHS